ncbi:MAG: transglycosylase domain-containing protein [Candidatus Dormibacteria bacterium]
MAAGGIPPRWRKVLKISAGFAALASGILGGMVAYAALTLPNVDDIGRATGTIKILDRNGKQIAEVGRNQQSRTTVKLDAIAPVMRDATLAAEDREFYTEGAFSVGRVMKALFVDVMLRRPAQGASTITQQLVNQAFFGGSKEKSAIRKLREALLANQISGHLSKDEILEKYLNLIYYGENAYGIENAATRYFGKHAKDLNIQESAMLAGLPEAPSFNDPFKNPGAAYNREHYVLDGLVKTGKVTQAEADAADPLVGGTSPDPEQQAAQQANQQRLLVDLQRGKPTSGGAAPHFVQYIQDQLSQEPYNVDPPSVNGDLTVMTTLDLGIQTRAEKSVRDGVDSLVKRRTNNGALIMIDAHTGDIRAMVGSKDFNDNTIAGQFNVITAERRPGSSFKPFVYETGFINGKLKPNSLLDDSRQESARLNGVKDFDNQYRGRITASQALLESRNIASEQAMVIAGVQNTIDFTHALGITSPLADNASTAIGTSAVKMIEHAGAYAAFANGGQKVQARGILKIQAANGDVLFDQAQPPGREQVMTPAQAYSITGILRNYQKQWHLPFKWDTAGKSGTTDNFVDAVYMTYTPDWVVGTWAGHTAADNPAEQPMEQVFGTDEAKAIAVPFVNTLPRPSAFRPVSGQRTACDPNADAGSENACPTQAPTFVPTPTPLTTLEPQPTIESTPLPALPTRPPLVTIPPIFTSAAPCPSTTPKPKPTATPVAGCP